MVWALAQQRPWEPPHTDPFVARSVAAALRDEGDVTAYELEEGTRRGEGVLGVVLDLRPGLAPEQVAPSPPGWGSGSPPTASCAPGSTASPSGCAEGSGSVLRTGTFTFAGQRFRWILKVGIGRESCDDFWDGAPLVTLCVDRPPFRAVCKRSPASTRVDPRVAGS